MKKDCSCHVWIPFVMFVLSPQLSCNWLELQFQWLAGLGRTVLAAIGFLQLILWELPPMHFGGALCS